MIECIVGSLIGVFAYLMTFGKTRQDRELGLLRRMDASNKFVLYCIDHEKSLPLGAQKKLNATRARFTEIREQEEKGC